MCSRPAWRIFGVFTLAILIPACTPRESAAVSDQEVVPAPPQPAARAADAPARAARWTKRAPLPERRTEVSVTTDGERVYLIGGFGPPVGQERATAPRAMWV